MGDLVDPMKDDTKVSFKAPTEKGHVNSTLYINGRKAAAIDCRGGLFIAAKGKEAAVAALRRLLVALEGDV